MTDLSREELRAHLSAVEAQVRAALRIVAAESKSVQQAHSALRADLSAALIRLQAEMNDGNKRIDGKVEKVISEINSLSRQRRLTAAILTTMVLLFGITLGLFAGGGWYLLSSNSNSYLESQFNQGTAAGNRQPSVSTSIPIPNAGSSGTNAPAQPAAQSPASNSTAGQRGVTSAQ